jgi:hypothetical protein
MINSDFLNGLEVKDAIKAVLDRDQHWASAHARSTTVSVMRATAVSATGGAIPDSV